MFVFVAEKRDLPGHSITMRRSRRSQRIVNAGEQLRAFTLQEIERAAFHEALEHFPIRDTGIEPPAKIFQRIEIAALFTFANGSFHRPLPDILDRSQSITNRLSVAAVDRRRLFASVSARRS